MRDVIAEPPARVGRAGVEDVVKRVKSDGEAGGATEAISWREHARGVENQQGMRKIARAENSDTNQQAAERWRQCL